MLHNRGNMYVHRNLENVLPESVFAKMTDLQKTILLGVAAAGVYLAVRGERKKDPIIHYVPHIPGGYNGICLPPWGLYIRDDQQGNAELIRHEMIHWQQYQRMGLLPYYYEYMRDYFIHGYDLHPMEQEARANEDDYCRVNYTECVRTGRAKTASNPNFRKA